MTGKAFLDTNILVYAEDQRQTEKQRQSQALIASLGNSGNGVLSTQVMQEFYAAATSKLKMTPLGAKAVLRSLVVFEVVPASPRLIYDAIDCVVLNRISFWDALIVAAAALAGCRTLFTEDLQPGQMLLGVRVVNPYLGSHMA